MIALSPSVIVMFVESRVICSCVRLRSPALRMAHVMTHAAGRESPSCRALMITLNAAIFCSFDDHSLLFLYCIFHCIVLRILDHGSVVHTVRAGIEGRRSPGLPRHCPDPLPGPPCWVHDPRRSCDQAGDGDVHHAVILQAEETERGGVNIYTKRGRVRGGDGSHIVKC
jgi:hypothetical protein